MDGAPPATRKEREWNGVKRRQTTEGEAVREALEQTDRVHAAGTASRLPASPVGLDARLGGYRVPRLGHSARAFTSAGNGAVKLSDSSGASRDDALADLPATHLCLDAVSGGYPVQRLPERPAVMRVARSVSLRIGGLAGR